MTEATKIQKPGPISNLRRAVARFGPRSRFALVSFGGQLVFAAITLGSSLIIARLLGAAGKGEYTAWTLVTLFGSLVLAGTISTGLGRAFLDGERRMLAPNALRHGLIALAATTLLAIPGLLLGLDPLPLIAFFVIAIPANVIVLDLLVVFQASKAPGAFQAIRIVKAVTLTSGLIAVAVFLADEARLFAFSLWAVGTVASALIGLLIVRRRYGFGRTGDGLGLRRIAVLGRGSLTTNLVDWMLLRADQFLVLALVGSFGLGVYSVAVNVAEVALYAGNSIGQAVFEDERTLTREGARRLLRKTFVVLATTTAVIVGIGIALVEPVFGEDFGGSRLPLLLLAPGMIARGLAFAGSQMILARGQGRPLARAMATLLVLDLAATALLTLAIGIEGTAIASSAIYVIQAAWVASILLRGPVGAAEEPTPGPPPEPE